MDRDPRDARPARRHSHDLWSVNIEAEYLEEGALVDALDGLDVIEARGLTKCDLAGTAANADQLVDRVQRDGCEGSRAPRPSRPTAR